MTEEKRLTMKDYVIETPEVALYNVDHAYELTKELVDLYLEKEYKSIWIVASGSSYNGSICAQEFLHKILKKEIKILNPFTFVNYQNDFTEDDFIVVCSQGGHSTNSIDALKLIASRNRHTIGITGDKESDFKNYSDSTLEWGVGIEKVGMVTKGVVTLAEYFMLFALEASKANGSMSGKEVDEWKDEIRKTMDAHKELQASSFAYIEKHQKELLSMSNVWIVSAGSNLSTAIEGALKIGESVKIHATAYEVEEFLHGPCFPLKPNYTVIAFDSNDHCRKRIQAVADAVGCVTDRVILVTSDPQAEGDRVIKCSTQIKEELNPLAYLAVCPLLAEYASEALATKMHPLYSGLREKISTKTPWKK